MIRHTVLLVLSIISLSQVDSEKQHVQLSDSYLPVAMQVIAHLTDQMAYELKDEVVTQKPTPKPTTKPATWTTRPMTWTTRPATTWTTKPAIWTTKPTTWTTSSWPYVTNGWWTSFTTKRSELTTPFHKPGLFAPHAPPKPSERHSWDKHRYVLLPVEQISEYTILGPKEARTEEPLLSIHHETIRPLVEKRPESSPLLPPHHFVKVASRSDSYALDDISEHNLQYLSDDVKEMIKMANDPNNDKVVDVFEGIRQGNQPISTTKAKLSASNLRLLLLYDLLSRDAKKQRLSDYSGFSPDVMKTLVESSSGGARAQLRMALSKMVERQDCTHEYANNRAREMVEELGKDESKMSSELRYLQPLIYQY